MWFLIFCYYSHYTKYSFTYVISQMANMSETILELVLLSQKDSLSYKSRLLFSNHSPYWLYLLTYEPAMKCLLFLTFTNCALYQRYNIPVKFFLNLIWIWCLAFFKKKQPSFLLRISNILNSWSHPRIWKKQSSTTRYWNQLNNHVRDFNHSCLLCNKTIQFSLMEKKINIIFNNKYLLSTNHTRSTVDRTQTWTWSEYT